MSDIPDGINSPPIAAMAVVWEMVKLAYPQGEADTESETRLRKMVNAFIRAQRAVEKREELTS